MALAGQGKTRGCVAISEIQLTLNQSIAAIIPNKDEIVPEYLYYKLDSMYDFLRNYSGGSNRVGLSLRTIRDIQIPLPPLPEQKQIAAILTQIDETIAAARETIESTKALKMKLINELLCPGRGD